MLNLTSIQSFMQMHQVEVKITGLWKVGHSASHVAPYLIELMFNVSYK